MCYGQLLLLGLLVTVSHILWCFYVRCVCVNICVCVISSWWMVPFLLYTVQIVSYYLFWLQVYFVWYELCLHRLPSISFAWSIIFNPSTFTLHLSLELRWVFWRQHIVLLFFNASEYSVSWWIQCITWIIIVRWKLSTAILLFVSWLLYISIISFICIYVCHFGLLGFCDAFLSLFFVHFHVSAVDLYFVFTVGFV